MRIDGQRYFTGFIRDLTERQQTETRLQELQTELVHVSRLTALGEMASALAHELNQPLSAIANYLKGSSMLLDRSRSPHDRVGDAVERAADEALRAGEIIRRLRDFVSRGETERRIESLSKLIEEASALALVGAKEHGVRVAMNFDRSVDRVLVDKVQIQQVVLNLIRNAIDAMVERRQARTDHRRAPRRRKPGRWSASATPGRGSGRSARTAVPAVLHDQARRHGGRPVDLAHHHRGAWRRICAPESRRGRRHVRFTLPTRRAGGCRMTNEPVVHVIDDDEAARHSLEFLLECAGYRVADYDSALAFLAICRADGQLEHGCIVTDVRMPDMTGVELVERLKELGVAEPVIVITGHADVPMAIQAMKAGVADFIEKPFGDDAILLGGPRRRSSARSRRGRSRGRRAARSAAPRLRCRSASAKCSTRLVEGKANKVIAFDLGISARTVEVYRANVMTKMQARSLPNWCEWRCSCLTISPRPQ